MMIADKDLELKWVAFGQDLKVFGKAKELLYNTITGYVSPVLTPAQVKWIGEHYQEKKVSYVF